MRKLLPGADRLSSLIAAVALLTLLPGEPLRAAPRVEADPNREYPVTPEIGPWMILAASYTGPTAPELARQMVLQIRQRDNLPAFFFNRGAEERRQEQERLARIRQFSPPDARIRTVRIEEQFAVLIGGYPDMDTARRALNDIKRLKPPDLKLGPNQTTMDRTIDPQTGRILEVNPFANSFVVRNPTTQREPIPEKGDDPFLKELNAGEDFSLLQCRKPYTLAVKEYHGVSVTQPRSGGSSFLEKIGLSRKSADMLSASALQAHELAKLLRQHLGMEAYVLHTRRSSVVTVGGFEGLNDPELQRVQQRLTSLSFGTGGSNASGDVLQLFSPAIPMRVPRP
jgi:hypothetical protein